MEEVDFSFMGDKVLDMDQSTELIKQVSREEIKKVLFSMDSSKAPCPDGFNILFFKLTWKILGENFLDAIQYFFVKGRLLKELNHTALSLIPKVANPSRMSDFVPLHAAM